MMATNDLQISTKSTIFQFKTFSKEAATNSNNSSDNSLNNLGLNRGEILAKIYQFRKNGENILPQEFQEKTQNVAKSIIFSPQLSLLKSLTEESHRFLLNSSYEEIVSTILGMPDQELLNFFFGTDSRSYLEQSCQNIGVNCAEAATILISELRKRFGNKAVVYGISQPPYSPSLVDGQIQNIPHPEFTGELQKFMQKGIHAITVIEIKNKDGEIKKYMFDPIFGIEEPILIEPGNLVSGNYSQIEIGNFAEDADQNDGFFYNIKYFNQKLVDGEIVPILADSISKFAVLRPISDFDVKTLGNKHAIRVFRKNNFTATENFWMQMKKKYESNSNGDYFYEFYLKSGKFKNQYPNLLDEKFTITAEEILKGFFEQNPNISQKINSKIPNFTRTILIDAALRYRLEKMSLIKRPEGADFVAQNINLPDFKNVL